MSSSRLRSAWSFFALFASSAFAANQTDTFTPVHVGNSYPYSISVQTYDFGTANLPTLQSFASATYDGSGFCYPVARTAYMDSAATERRTFHRRRRTKKFG